MSDLRCRVTGATRAPSDSPGAKARLSQGSEGPRAPRTPRTWRLDVLCTSLRSFWTCRRWSFEHIQRLPSKLRKGQSKLPSTFSMRLDSRRLSSSNIGIEQVSKVRQACPSDDGPKAFPAVRSPVKLLIFSLQPASCDSQVQCSRGSAGHDAGKACSLSRCSAKRCLAVFTRSRIVVHPPVMTMSGGSL